MSAMADELRRQIDYNTTNMGELGRFIRVEHVHAILDKFIVTGYGSTQNTTLDQARAVLRDAHMGDERAVLGRLAGILLR